MSDSKLVPENISNSLGVTELILGSAGAYSLWLNYSSTFKLLFPSTGNEFIDISLLALAAAIIGKTIYLMIQFFMALLNIFIQKKRVLGYFEQLKKAFSNFINVTDLNAYLSNCNKKELHLMDLAVSMITSAEPTTGVELERTYNKIIIAYGVVLLGIPFGIYFYNHQAPAVLKYGSILLVIIFFGLGFLEQLNYIKSLADMLLALKEMEQKGLNKKKEKSVV